jgi:hypothetical protein
MRMSWLAVIGAPLLALAVFPAMGQQGTGYLKTKVEPGRAGVFIDGKYVGPAANFRIGRKYALAAGEHEVRLSDPRHDEYVTKVTIQAGKTTKLVQTLKDLPAARPPFGRLRTIAGDKFAAVYVNGRYMGHVDEFSNSSQGLLLNPGQYTVKVISAGSEQGHEEQVNIAADSVTIVRAVK